MRRTVLAIVAVLASIAWTSTAFADATPIQMMLLYLPDVSNTGTSAASGIAELVMPEGEVRVSATGLPQLEGSDRYVAWLVNSRTNQFMRLGGFNSNSIEVVHYEDVLPAAIPNKQWNLLLVTIETSTDAARPSTRHSIAGIFPRSERDAPPQLLPNTGGADELSATSIPQSATGWASWLSFPVLPALALLLGCAAGYAVARRRSARSLRAES
jgi:hypothetical protein